MLLCKRSMSAVNPRILTWARETAGLTRQQAAKKVDIGPARGLSAVERLAALERGDEDPSRALLFKMAGKYRRPLLTFYLSEPPPPGDRGADFRTLQVPPPPDKQAVVDALVRNVLSRQNIVRAALEAQDEIEPLSFVGSLRHSDGLQVATAALRRVLDSGSQPPPGQATGSGAAAPVARVDGAVVGRYHAAPNAQCAFSLLRASTEAAGVFVLLKGDLGSHHTQLDPESFRGFAISDAIAPFVVINNYDSRVAWSFTLLHELTHLLLGQTGISGSNPGSGVERFCNMVASEWLLPAKLLDQLHFREGQDLATKEQLIEEFARRRNLSRTMVAYRLLRINRIGEESFELMSERFRSQWQLGRQNRTGANHSGGGPSYYQVGRHRLGRGLLSFARQMLDSRELSTTKVARVLAVKPAQVDRMLG